jgi:hypothetical protein
MDRVKYTDCTALQDASNGAEVACSATSDFVLQQRLQQASVVHCTGVAWFEVDRADVLDAKRTAMTSAGASFAPSTGKAHMLAGGLDATVACIQVRMPHGCPMQSQSDDYSGDNKRASISQIVLGACRRQASAEGSQLRQPGS